MVISNQIFNSAIDSYRALYSNAVMPLPFIIIIILDCSNANNNNWRHYVRLTKSMVFTSKKVSLRVKNNVYSAMVLSVLLHGAAEPNCLG